MKSHEADIKWAKENGSGSLGNFFDVPFSAFCLSGEDTDFVYQETPSEEGELFDVPGQTEEVYIFDRTRKYRGRGRYHTSVMWPKDNLLLYLVSIEGKLMLWPPHKVSFCLYSNPQALPSWRKRRYSEDVAVQRGTPNTLVSYSKKLKPFRKIALQALSSTEDWRAHGIGVLQKYVDEYRVHVWHSDLLSIGLEGGIHNHRYDLTSTLLYGELLQEEWLPEENKDGFWELWEHSNSTDSDRNPRKLNKTYRLTCESVRLKAGVEYSFPAFAFHRSVPVDEICISVIERSNFSGKSQALIPKGQTPVNGLDKPATKQDIEKVLSRAWKLYT